MIKAEEYILENSKKMFAIDVKGHSKEILAVPINIALEAISLTSKETSQKAIEILDIILGDWVHGGDADCIMAEFKEKLSTN